MTFFLLTKSATALTSGSVKGPTPVYWAQDTGSGYWDQGSLLTLLKRKMLRLYITHFI